MTKFYENRPQVPSCEDFTSSFGCDCSIDKDLVQICEFRDELGKFIQITFGLLDKSFGLSMSCQGSKLLEVYDEYLTEATVDESNNLIKEMLTSNELIREITITVWPKAIVNIKAMHL